MNLKTQKTHLIILLFSSIFSSSVLPKDKCQLSLSITSVTLSFNLDQDQTRDQTITVTRDDNQSGKDKFKSDCQDFYVTATRGNASDYNRYMLQQNFRFYYQLKQSQSSQTMLKDILDISSQEQYISGSFSGNSVNKDVIISLVAPVAANTTPLLVPSGSYSDTVILKVFQGTYTKDDIPDASVPFNVKATVPPMVDLSLIERNSQFNLADNTEHLNFGLLQTGKTMGLDMRVRSNSGFQIYLSSANNGSLKNTLSGPNSLIPYTLKVDQTLINLIGSSSKPVLIKTSNGQTGLTGVPYPVDVTIGDAKNRDEGNYNDQISISVFSNN